jgi:hypothetical protein
VIIGLPLVLFVYLLIKIENGRLYPGIIPHGLHYGLRMSAAAVTFCIIFISGIYTFLSARKARRHANLRLKLNYYFRISVYRISLMLAAMTVNLAGMALTGERIYAAFFGIVLVAALLGYPSPSRIIHLLKLDEKEAEIIYNREPIG